MSIAMKDTPLELVLGRQGISHGSTTKVVPNLDMAGYKFTPQKSDAAPLAEAKQDFENILKPSSPTPDSP